jgi:ABC-type nitrate/sulfonate/bicarbonate transport system substrate-binding protein
MSLGTIAGVWQANQQGADLVNVAGVQNISYYRMVASPDITDVTQLAGRKLGVSETEIGIDAFIAKIWLDRLEGIDSADVEFVNTGGQGSRVAALTSGAIDATLASAPAFLPVLAEGFSDLGASVDVIPHIQQTTVVIDRPNLDVPEQREKFLRFMRAYVRAAQFISDPANRDAVIAALVAQLQTSEEDAALFYDLYVPTGVVTLDGGLDIEGVRIWADFVGTDPDTLIDETIDLTLLEAVKS